LLIPRFFRWGIFRRNKSIADQPYTSRSVKKMAGTIPTLVFYGIQLLRPSAKLTNPMLERAQTTGRLIATVVAAAIGLISSPPINTSRLCCRGCFALSSVSPG